MSGCRARAKRFRVERVLGLSFEDLGLGVWSRFLCMVEVDGFGLIWGACFLLWALFLKPTPQSCTVRALVGWGTYLKSSSTKSNGGLRKRGTRI